MKRIQSSSVFLFGLLQIGCSSETGADAPANLSVLQEALGEAACATATPGYSQTANANGLWGHETTTFDAPCGGSIAEVAGLAGHDYVHFGNVKLSDYPTNATTCANTYLGVQGMDITCGLSCYFAQDPNDATYDNPAYFQGVWGGSSCTFQLMAGSQPLPYHVGSWKYAARTATAAIQWTGSTWITLGTFTGVYRL